MELEPKLKALKVADLKDVLTRAKVAFQARANKQDLINKILASTEAIDVYNTTYGPVPAENVLAAPFKSPAKSEAPPPTKATTNISSLSPAKTAAASVPTSTPASQAASKATDASPSEHAEQTSTPDSSQTKTAENDGDEAERRKARAARFGIPVVESKAVEPKRAAPQNGKAAVNGKASPNASAVDPEKLAARAARFGIQADKGRKRAPPSEPLDEEEVARRKKRAERFGIPLVGA